MQLPIRKGELARRLTQTTDNYYTQDKIDQMKQELETLQNVKRPKIIVEMQRAAEDGDFSENFPYQQAKGRLRGINERITTIEELLKTAIIIDESASKDGVIQIGSTVTLNFSGRTVTYQIVGVAEANPLKGIISYQSPLGKMLIGRREGETVVLKTERGETPYRVENVA